MSWDKFFVVVTQQENENIIETVKNLNLSCNKFVGKVNWYEANDSEALFVTNVNNNLIFLNQELPYKFFKPHNLYKKNTPYPNEIEKQFIRKFPNSFIYSLIEDGSGGSFGFSIIKNGVKIRMKNGNQSETYNDIGKEIPEEEISYQNFIKSLEEFGGEEQLVKEMGEDEYDMHVDFETSWGTTLLLINKLLGQNIYDIDGQNLFFYKFEK